MLIAFLKQTDFTMILLRFLLVITWTISNCCFDGMTPEGLLLGEHDPINEEDAYTQTIQTAQRMFLNPDPIDDSQRVSALFVLAQRNVHELRIPEELHYIVFEYSDYNEIRTLFQVTLGKRRVLGFGSYQEFHRNHPIRQSKMMYLGNCGVNFGSDGRLIGIDWRGMVLRSINWNAISGLKYLRYLYLGYVRFEVSMQGLQSLPDSMEALIIEGCIWTESYLDTCVLPPGLIDIDTRHTQIMTRLLRPDARHLTPVILGHRRIRTVDLSVLPSSMHNVRPRKRSSWNCDCVVM